MLPSHHYMTARDEARYHVQVQVSHIGEIVRTPGFVDVRGTVTRIFRTDGLLEAGHEINFEVPVTRPGDELPCGGVLWKQFDALRDAPCVEAFLNNAPPRCVLALSQCHLLDAPTDHPVMHGRNPVHRAEHRIRRRLMAWIARL